MDLNELLHAHQVEVMKASASGDERSRQSHFKKVALYAERIRQLRQSRRTADPSPAARWQETIRYGTYAGDPAPSPSASALTSWESEGGALYPPIIPPSAGIITKLVREFHVGPYVYQDLSLAMAEYERQSRRASFDG